MVHWQQALLPPKTLQVQDTRKGRNCSRGLQWARSARTLSLCKDVSCDPAEMVQPRPDERQTNDRRTTDDDSQTATARRPAPREFPPRYKWSCPSQIRGAPRVHGALLVIRTLCGWCWPSVASCAGVRLRGIWLPSVHQSLGSPSFIPSPSIHLHPDPQPPLSAQPSDTRSRCCTPPFIFQSTGAVRARS